MHEQFFPADRLFFQHPELHQLLEVTRGGLAHPQAPLRQVLDAAIRQLKDRVDQFMAVNLWGGFNTSTKCVKKKIRL